MIFSKQYILVSVPDGSILGKIRPGSALYGTIRLPIRVEEQEHEVWSGRIVVDHSSPEEVHLEFLSPRAPLQQLAVGASIDFYRSPHSREILTVVGIPQLHRP